MEFKDTERIVKNAVDILISRGQREEAQLLVSARLSFNGGFVWDPSEPEPPILARVFLEVEPHRLVEVKQLVAARERALVDAIWQSLQGLGFKAITDDDFGLSPSSKFRIDVRIIPSEVYPGWRQAYWEQLREKK